MTSDIDIKPSVQDYLNLASTLSCCTDSPKVIYSVCLGNYDLINNPIIDSEYERILISDDKSLPLSYNGWHVVSINSQGFERVRLQRFLKAAAHILFPHTSIAIYCDSSVKFFRDISDLASSVQDIPFSVLRHPNRSNVYEEADACIEQGKCEKIAIDTQISRYRRENMPQNTPLYSTPIVFRNLDNPRVRTLSDLWARELVVESYRDQLSLPYIAWKLNFKINAIPLNQFYNPYFATLPHRNAPTIFRLKSSMLLLSYRAYSFFFG